MGQSIILFSDTFLKSMNIERVSLGHFKTTLKKQSKEKKVKSFCCHFRNHEARYHYNFWHTMEEVHPKIEKLIVIYQKLQL